MHSLSFSPLRSMFRFVLTIYRFRLMIPFPLQYNFINSRMKFLLAFCEKSQCGFCCVFLGFGRRVVVYLRLCLTFFSTSLFLNCLLSFRLAKISSKERRGGSSSSPSLISVAKLMLSYSPFGICFCQHVRSELCLCSFSL